ncbi:MAG: glucose-6-phosphate isomerase family protein [Candidatus Portnoybacteria bacterium]
MDLTKLIPDIRHLSEMKELLYDQEWAKTAPDSELYLMYRDLSGNPEDKEKINQSGLRYDITVMMPVILGKEYNKTSGHDHPVVPNTDITYTELYQVLEGEIVFLIQDSEKDEIKDVYAIKAKQDDKVVIPPNYEHLMVNASGKEAKTANWICRDFGSNIYKPFRSKQGFGYYALKDNSRINWVKNENYSSVPELKFLEPNRLLEQFGLNKEKPIYQLVNDLSKLDFLKTPQNYNW